MASERILIIGGGFTGLAAAYELIKLQPDLQLTIVEKASTLGGLATGFDICGTSLEKTYHYLFLTDSKILGLARELGLESQVIWADSTVGVYLGGRVFPFTTPLDLIRFSPCSFSGRVRLGFTMLYLQKTRNWKRLAPHSGREWLAKTCGRSAMQTIWEPLLKGKFSRYSGDVSMAWIWARVHSRANSRSQGGEKLGYFRGGFAAVVNKLEDTLRKAGVKLLTNSSVDAIDLTAGQRKIKIQGESIPFDQCLFTGPSSALAKLLPAGTVSKAYLEQLESVNYLGAVCLIFASRQSLARQFWINIHDDQAPFLVFVQHTNLLGTDLYQGKHIYYLGCYLPTDSPVYREDEKDLARRWFSYLKQMFPEFDPNQVEEQHLFRFNAAQHVVDTNYESRIPDHRTPAPGLFLANFSQIFPEDRGTNFAVRDGIKVAGIIAEELRRERERNRAT